MFSHLTFASDGRHPLFPTLAQRRRAVRCIAAIGVEVILFSVVDDHVHVVADAARAARVGRIAAGLCLALRPIAAAPLLRAFVRPVETRGHLEWLANDYLLTQARKHGLPGHLALDEGSCFLDLAGARAVFDPPLATRLARALPRYLLRNAFRAVGLEPTPLRAVSDEELRALGAVRIAAATEAALAAVPGLKGNGPVERTARRAVAALAARAGIASAECAFALAIDPSSVARLQDRPVLDSVHLAIRKRLALELRVYPELARSIAALVGRARAAALAKRPSTDRGGSDATPGDRSLTATDLDGSGATPGDRSLTPTDLVGSVATPADRSLPATDLVGSVATPADRSATPTTPTAQRGIT